MLKPFHTAEMHEAGCDEAGRGCLAGAVFAATVIFPAKYTNSQLNDSKKLTASKRETLRREIEEEALYWQVAQISPQEIDEINILNASFKAMHQALESLSQQPLHIIVDGNRFINYKQIPHTCIVKGDQKYLSIAAASILAKTHRDQYMEQLHLRYPEYGWSQNKGYPTQKHRAAIHQYGLTPFHRKTFQLK